MNAKGSQRRAAGPALRHPIGVVARRTGISLHVLRAWERRYAVVEPVRTAGGQRLYSDADIERLLMLRRATDAGRAISQVASMSDAALTRLVEQDERARRSPPPRPGDADAWLAACLAASERLDGEAVHGALLRAVVALPARDFLQQVMLPLLHEVGERWHGGRIGPAQEHVVSVAARRVLGWLLDAYTPDPGAPVLVSTTVAEEMHEFGAMVVGAVALEEGWRVAYLGPSLPASEIARAARELGATVVAISVVNRDHGNRVHAEVRSLRRLLPAEVLLLAGGAGAATRHEQLAGAGAQVVTGFDEARETLRLHRQRAAAR